jgi:hypothetical protein
MGRSANKYHRDWIATGHLDRALANVKPIVPGAGENHMRIQPLAPVMRTSRKDVSSPRDVQCSPAVL